MVTLYSEAYREQKTCDLECEHTLVYNAQIHVEQTGKMSARPYGDTGVFLTDYEYSTKSGYIVWQRGTVDSPGWVDTDKRHWYTRPRNDYGKSIALSLSGERL